MTVGFCSSCGKPNNQGGEFCGGCGKRLVSEGFSPPPTPASIAGVTPSRETIRSERARRYYGIGARRLVTFAGIVEALIWILFVLVVVVGLMAVTHTDEYGYPDARVPGELCLAYSVPLVFMVLVSRFIRIWASKAYEEWPQ